MLLLRFRRNILGLLKQLASIWLLTTIIFLYNSFLLQESDENKSNKSTGSNAASRSLFSNEGDNQFIPVEPMIIDNEKYAPTTFAPKSLANQDKNSDRKKVSVVDSLLTPTNGSLPHSVQRRSIPDQKSTEPPPKTISKMLDPRSTYPSLYSLYSQGKVKSGLSYIGTAFTLNGINLRILSGSINYFRVHPHYWKDRLKKLRALGFNTVETYVPWNIHEQRAGQYNFMGGWANVRKFIETAKEEDLLVILRPGPYICSQWDFGGLPSFLLRKDGINYRSLDPSFLKPALNYLKALSRALVDLQWSQKYGAQPLIMIQLENEFNITSGNVERDKQYLLELKKSMVEEGMTEVQYVVTNKIPFIEPSKMVPGILQAVTIVSAVAYALTELKSIQPDKPLMVMEYWTGMYDRWFDNKPAVSSSGVFVKNFVGILTSEASVNLYMFHGGSNFGFLGGGARIKNETIPMPTTTSFDFGAPLSESGDYTKKYWLLRRLIASVPSNPPYRVADPPEARPAREYSITFIDYYIPFEDMIKSLPITLPLNNTRNMEALNINMGSGQGYGFILYRKTSLKLNPGAVLKVKGVVRDILYIIIDGNIITEPIRSPEQLTEHGYWMSRNPEFPLPGDGGMHQLDLLVENVARFDSRDLNNQRKGIRGSVYLDDQLLSGWKIYPLEFKKLWLESNRMWRPFDLGSPIHAPALFKGVLNIEKNDLHDTFINTMEEESQWTKGQVFINGFNLGRYWNVGPTKTLYVPAPLLKTGDNEIIFFELFKPGKYIHFEDSALIIN